jgi:hypothetical protein
VVDAEAAPESAVDDPVIEPIVDDGSVPAAGEVTDAGDVMANEAENDAIKADPQGHLDGRPNKDAPSSSQPGSGPDDAAHPTDEQMDRANAQTLVDFNKDLERARANGDIAFEKATLENIDKVPASDAIKADPRGFLDGRPSDDGTTSRRGSGADQGAHPTDEQMDRANAQTLVDFNKDLERARANGDIAFEKATLENIDKVPASDTIKAFADQAQTLRRLPNDPDGSSPSDSPADHAGGELPDSSTNGAPEPGASADASDFSSGKATPDETRLAADWATPTDLPPNATIDAGRYQFGTDDLGRLVQATGDLELEAGKRQRPDADRVRKMIASDFRDQAGHLIAARFNGPGDNWNMVPQDQNLNVSEWKIMENEWAKALDEGYSVHVDIAMNYHGEDLRPWAFNVEYTFTSPDGEVNMTQQRDILNAPRAAHD